MKPLKLVGNYRRVLQQIAIGIAASLCLASLAEATAVNTAKDNISATNIEIAQSTSVCPQSSGGSQFVSAETPNFLVYICGGDLPNTYVGVAKRGGNGITLPLRSYSRDRFVAVNANTTYTLTRTQLIVTQNGRVIRRERATWK